MWWFSRKKSNKKKPKNKIIHHRLNADLENAELTTNLDANINRIKASCNDSSDIVFRKFDIGKYHACLIYISGLTNNAEVSEQVLQQLMLMENEELEISSLNQLVEKKITATKINKTTNVSELLNNLSSGSEILLVDTFKDGLIISLPNWEKRGIEEPSAEQVVRGPREGFTETLEVNTSLIRRRIRSPKLTIHSKKIGIETKTDVAIAYIHGIAKENLVQEVHQRLDRINVDGIIDSGYIEEFIEDNPYSPFPQTLNTERPDVITSYLLEGHVAIIVDGSPFILVVPTTFYSLLQASEDYYERYIIGTILRWLRYVFLVIALLFPSLYVAVLSFHQEMLPTSLIISIAGSRENVPFPALIEALLVEIMFEILREAGLRLPEQVGAAVGIVGALVIGEAAVSAGIVSAPMVIVVAVTGIASFAIPRYNAGISIRMLRFPIIILAGSMGLLGIILGIIIIIIHLCSLRSFGVPYLSPLAPMMKNDIKDVLMRAPIWKMNTRPHLTGDTGESRQGRNQQPSPARGGD